MFAPLQFENELAAAKAALKAIKKEIKAMQLFESSRQQDKTSSRTIRAELEQTKQLAENDLARAKQDLEVSTSVALGDGNQGMFMARLR